MTFRAEVVGEDPTLVSRIDSALRGLAEPAADNQVAHVLVWRPGAKLLRRENRNHERVAELERALEANLGDLIVPRRESLATRAARADAIAFNPWRSTDRRRRDGAWPIERDTARAALQITGLRALVDALLGDGDSSLAWHSHSRSARRDRG